MAEPLTQTVLGTPDQVAAFNADLFGQDTWDRFYAGKPLNYPWHQEAAATARAITRDSEEGFPVVVEEPQNNPYGGFRPFFIRIVRAYKLI